MTDAAETHQPALKNPAEAAKEAAQGALVDDMRALTGAFHAFAAKVEDIASRAGRTLHLDEAVEATEKAFTAISLHVHEVTSTEAEQPQLALAAPSGEAKPS